MLSHQGLFHLAPDQVSLCDVRLTSMRCFVCPVQYILTSIAVPVDVSISDIEHVFIAGSFFHYAGGFDAPKSLDISPNPGRSDPMFIVKAQKSTSS